MQADGTGGVYAELHRAVVEAGGATLFTVTALDRTAGLARRTYTSHPGAYPVTGTKPMSDDGWSRQVIGEGRSFVANTTAEFAVWFPDHALINSLGCEAALNIPVKDGGVVVATVNLLDRRGHYTPDRVAAMEVLVRDRTPALLAALASEQF
jgi:GAF domain